MKKTKQQELIEKLDEYKTHVDEQLVPKLESLRVEVDNPEATFKTLNYMVKEIGELLLQTQLKVDGVICDDDVEIVFVWD